VGLGGAAGGTIAGSGGDAGVVVAGDSCGAGSCGRSPDNASHAPVPATATANPVTIHGRDRDDPAGATGS
jgi:hypothetical protein